MAFKVASCSLRNLRASLAVVGPTGCGKTIGFAIPAPLEWNGPIIATSVKTDLLDAHASPTVQQPELSLGLLTRPRAVGSQLRPGLRSAPAATGAARCACGDLVVRSGAAESQTASDGDYWYSQDLGFRPVPVRRGPRGGR